jgi:hypothetical protein
LHVPTRFECSDSKIPRKAPERNHPKDVFQARLRVLHGYLPGGLQAGRVRALPFWCNFVAGNTCKAQSALFPETKWHIQKCNTCRDIENQVAEFAISQWYSRAIFYRPETTLVATDSAKAAPPTPDITLYYWVSKLHAMSSRE